MADTLRYARAYTDPDGQRALADEPAGTPIPYVASRPGVKRDGMDLRAAGWRTDRYRLNPAVLWCHDPKTPTIGTAEAHPEPAQLRMWVTFDQEDPFAVRIESKVRRRIMPACSVGWDFVDEAGNLLNWRRLTDDDITNRAFYDLTELSIVPVGADPDALTARRRAALRSLSREMVALYDAQERPDSDVDADQLRAAVRAELHTLGLDIDAGHTTVRAAHLDEADLKLAVREAFAELLADHGAITINDWRRMLGRAAIPAHDTPVREGDWDGPGAVAKCPADRKSLRAIHAWVDNDGDPDAKASYSLPHHDEPGGPANLNGVRNALARLPQTDMPDGDRAAVEAHLRRHLEAQDGGDRAHGGLITADTAYLVGERGCELTIPATAGRIVSTTSATGAAITITTRHDDDTPPPAGVRQPAPDPIPPTEDPAAHTAVDETAARDLLAAFHI